MNISSRKLAVIGPGAIGGYLGARLALAGEDVTLVARGKTLKAIQDDGITLIEANGVRHTSKDARAVSLGQAGTFDVVLLALKAQQVSVIAADLPRVFHSEWKPFWAGWLNWHGLLERPPPQSIPFTRAPSFLKKLLRRILPLLSHVELPTHSVRGRIMSFADDSLLAR